MRKVASMSDHLDYAWDDDTMNLHIEEGLKGNHHAYNRRGLLAVCWGYDSSQSTPPHLQELRMSATSAPCVSQAEMLVALPYTSCFHHHSCVLQRNQQSIKNRLQCLEHPRDEAAIIIQRAWRMYMAAKRRHQVSVLTRCARLAIALVDVKGDCWRVTLPPALRAGGSKRRTTTPPSSRSSRPAR
jgi:hypothetical protein